MSWCSAVPNVWVLSSDSEDDVVVENQNSNLSGVNNGPVQDLTVSDPKWCVCVFVTCDDVILFED